MIWILLIVFQLKHFIADYPLQTSYMLGKFKPRDWQRPLAAHCSVHYFFTFLICLIAGAEMRHAVILGLLDFSIHFVMDRIKASPNLLGRFEALSKDQMRGLLESRSLCKMTVDYYIPSTPVWHTAADKIKTIDKRIKSNKYFWWALGFDQMIHHVTDLLIIFLLVRLL